jgi:hypothetical protein
MAHYEVGLLNLKSISWKYQQTTEKVPPKLLYKKYI